MLLTCIALDKIENLQNYNNVFVVKKSKKKPGNESVPAKWVAHVCTHVRYFIFDQLGLMTTRLSAYQKEKKGKGKGEISYGFSYLRQGEGSR